jgi:hypothetical protein
LQISETPYDPKSEPPDVLLRLSADEARLLCHILYLMRWYNFAKKCDDPPKARWFLSGMQAALSPIVDPATGRR